jgi:hypothetical protein
MSGIWIRGGELCGVLVDIVGFKLGISVSLERLASAIDEAGLRDLWPMDLDAIYRYRPEEVEELTRVVLAAMGDPDAVAPAPGPLFSFLLKFKDKPEEMVVMEDLIEMLQPFVEATPKGTALDPRPYVEQARAAHAATDGYGRAGKS